MITASAPMMYQWYCSHIDGARKRISLPGGSLLSLIPNRCSCRQSKTGLLKSPVVTGIFAVEDTQREPCRRLADRDRGRNKATGTAMTHVGLHVHHDWPIGHFREGRERLIRSIGHSGAIDIDRCVDDRRIRW